MTETAGQRIRRRRLELGYTRQKEFCKLIGMAQSTLSEIERGESNFPSAKYMNKLCEVLQVTDAWIMYGKDGELKYPTDMENQILTDMRKLTADQQAAIYEVIKGMVKK